MKGVEKEASTSSDVKKRKKEESTDERVKDYAATLNSAKGSSNV